MSPALCGSIANDHALREGASGRPQATRVRIVLGSRPILAILGAGVAIIAASIEPSVSASAELRQPGVKQVVDELVNYGARNAFAYVSDQKRAYAAVAGAGPPRTRGTGFASAA